MVIEKNYSVAEKTYGSFIGMVKWGAGSVAIIAAIVVFLISR